MGFLLPCGCSWIKFWKNSQCNTVPSLFATLLFIKQSNAHAVVITGSHPSTECALQASWWWLELSYNLWLSSTLLCRETHQQQHQVPCLLFPFVFFVSEIGHLLNLRLDKEEVRSDSGGGGYRLETQKYVPDAPEKRKTKTNLKKSGGKKGKMGCPISTKKRVGNIVWFRKNDRKWSRKKETRSKRSTRKRTNPVDLWSDSCGDSGADTPPLAARPTVWLPACTNIPAHKWDHHPCFPPSPPVDYPAPCFPLSHLVDDPARSRLFWWHCVLVPPSTFCVSTTCPSPWQRYHNCNYRERVDCLVYVTHSQRSINS